MAMMSDVVVALGSLCVPAMVSLFVVIPVPVNVIVTASSLVYLGAVRSMSLLPAAKKKKEDSITLSSRDAMRFPLVGSAFLAGTFVLIRFFGKDIINLLLTAYFACFGALVVEQALEQELRPQGFKGLCGCWAAASALVAWYTLTKHWFLNNAIAACLCVSGLESVSVGSFRNAAILLCGLFLYDVYWVFFSHKAFGDNVMVTVAKGLDGPIKLLFRREPIGPNNFSFLGLGDVVVPGLFAALVARYDVKHSVRHFRPTILAYALGLALTLYVMYAFDAAQPALLYLVPAVLGASMLSAIAKGDLKRLLAYSEEEEEEDDHDDDQGNMVKKKDDDDDTRRQLSQRQESNNIKSDDLLQQRKVSPGAAASKSSTNNDDDAAINGHNHAAAPAAS